MKEKILTEGQSCRKCRTPVIKKKGGNKIKPGQRYYFRYYLDCPGCGTKYMLNSEKVMIDQKLKKEVENASY
ncbi:MAG: hypothetical protein R3182_14300 [Draconibacterium sp.]|nr:hypothetical protein [Draconibacterium sp.]